MPPTLIIMGVSGSGKSVIGSLLAERLGGVFDDGDDYHPPSNKAKMSAGTPLTDEDRWPWYATLRQRIVDMRGKTSVHVLGCSALKPVYRDRLRADDTDKEIAFVLLDGSRELITARMAARKGHFMPLSLLESQLATLQPTPDLVRVSIDATPEEIVTRIVEHFDRSE
ncbi:MAG: gluconokinase [Verrucomicrobiaceae bacterium]|nr:gluconokinase [Verrucomicrobiaceae bacterium]